MVSICSLVPHAHHLSSHPNLRQIEFESPFEFDGWTYDVEKLLSDGFIQNPNVEILRIRWDITKRYESLFEDFAYFSVLILESLCQGISVRAEQFCKLRSIAFEAFEGPKAEWQLVALPLDDRSGYDWLVDCIRNKLPIFSKDDSVQCCSVRGLDMSKMEIEVRVRVVPSRSNQTRELV